MNRFLLVILSLLILVVGLGLYFSGVLAPRPVSEEDRTPRVGDDARLGPGSTDFLAGTFTGTVLSDLTGKPIPGALVRADFTGPEGTVEMRDHTEETGEFRLENLRPGTGYRVAFFSESYATTALELLELPTGKTVDLGTIRLGRPVRIEGRVIDVKGRPIPNATVTAMRHRDLMFGGDWLSLTKTITTAPRPLEEVKTDADGRFAMSTLAAGRYGLRALARGFAPTTRQDVLAAAGPQHAPIEIVLERGNMVEGRVEDGEGVPIEGAEVAMDVMTSFLDAFEGRMSTVTDQDGRFEFPSVTSGMYIVAARAAGHPLSIRGPVRVPLRGKLTIRMAGSALLTGTVKNQAGEGVAGAQVWAVVGLIGWGTELVETGPDGVYRIPNLPTGPLMFLSVIKEGYAPYPEGPLGGRGRPGVNLVGGEETRHDVTLRSGAKVSGKILTPDGRPIAGANVRVICGQTSMLAPTTAISREDGSYMVGGVGAGRAIVMARAAGFTQDLDPRRLGAVMSRRAQLEGASGAMVIIGPEDRHVTCDVVLEAACSVAGNVTDPEGKPVTGARIGLVGPAWQRFFRGRIDITGGATAQTVSDENGEFLLDGVNAGDAVKLEARASGYAPGESAGLALRAGQTITGVELKLSAGGKITGTVLTEAGDPVENALVRVAATGQEWALVFGSGDPDPVRTDAQGRFEKTVFGNDPLSVKVDAEGFVSNTTTDVRVEPGATREDLEIVLVPSLTLGGAVLGPDGSPVNGAYVRVRREGPRRRGFEDLSNLTGPEGEFLIEGLDAGTYTVIVQSSLAPEQRLPGVEAGSSDVIVRLPAGLRISGRVVDEGGAPVADVTLRTRMSGSRGGRINTDERGAFRFENLGAGKWSIRYQPEQGDIDPYLPAEVKGIEAGSGDVVITLRRGLDVMGMVLGPQGGPAPGVTVMLTSKGDRRSTMTDQGGRFDFGGLADRTWTVTATGAKGAAGRLDGVKSGELDVLVQLATSLPIEGRVLDPRGRPPEISVYVAVTPEGSDRAVAFVMTDIDGSFAIAGLAPGRYVVKTADQEGLNEASRTVSAGVTNVILRLTPKDE